METPGLFPVEDEPQPARPSQRLAEGVYCHVAVNRPMRCEYTYAIPERLARSIAPGMRVAVPFSGRREVAVVVAVDGDCDISGDRLKAVGTLLDVEPIVDGELLELTRWMASYYACSWGEALAAVLPAALKHERGERKVMMVRATEGVGAAELAHLEEPFPKQHRLLRTLLAASGPMERSDLLRRTGLSYSPLHTLTRKGWVRVESVQAAPDALLAGSDGSERPCPEQLTVEQERAVGRIVECLDAARFATVLLKGVTGSGKTEVYLRVIEETLERGRGAIVLVPEIALTPQTVGWFRSRFGEVAVLHSRMTDNQRLAMWRRVRRGECRVVVGARSAVFAPVKDLGVVVVDEEHEPSFKQSSTPRYHGRDVAVMRARKAQAVCILGSATPSLESWSNAKRGRYELLELPRRVHGGPMPTIQVVDMRTELAQTRMPALFSRTLHQHLEGTLSRGEQAILFLNRRGFAPVLWCSACGETVRCTACDAPRTFHKRIARLVCHLCCEEIRPPTACPTCSAPTLRYLGTGSERVEDVLRELFPEARVGRMDSDTMLRRQDYEETLSAFGAKELDVLVGTQMIAKGLDFPGVTLVGIVSADSTLHLPDFRASERTFQLISQVSGRAGRGDLAGHIVIQTVTPEHPAVVQAARHDYETFVAIESQPRAELGYPPFGRLIRVVFEDQQEDRVQEAAGNFAALLTEHVVPEGVVLLGPSPAPLAMVRGRHRLHLLLKGSEEGTGMVHARSLLVRLAAGTVRPRVAIDVDPVGMM